MTPQPYIGVTGFMNIAEVTEAQTAFSASFLNKNRLLMVGVLASAKTLAGQKNKYPRRYPDVTQIKNIFTPGQHQVLNLIHYATDNPDSLNDELLALNEIGGPFFHGFQLNIAWPPPSELEKYRLRDSRSRVVLQIGGAAMDKVLNCPNCIARKIFEYRHLITDILLDASGGKGKPLNPAKAREYLLAIKELLPNIGCGVAGGLGPPPLHLLNPLFKEFTSLSFDAESGLRNAEDNLSLPLVKEYLEQASQMIG